ncbi:MAG: hypothetical protein WBA12_09620 [Catalinimonas sp.]
MIRQLLLFPLLLGLVDRCTPPPDAEADAAAAVRGYVRGHLDEVLARDAPLRIDKLQKREGYQKGQKMPIFYRTYVETALRDTSGTPVPRRVEVRLDSTLHVTSLTVLPPEGATAIGPQ